MKYWELVLKEVAERYLPTARFFYIHRHSPLISEDAMSKKPKKKTILYPLGPKYPGITLTEREAECISHAIRGKSIRKIGDLLALSPRTIEYYFARIRIRLNCATKAELVEKVLDSDFMKEIIIVEDEDGLTGA